MNRGEKKKKKRDVGRRGSLAVQTSWDLAGGQEGAHRKREANTTTLVYLGLRFYWGRREDAGQRSEHKSPVLKGSISMHARLAAGAGTQWTRECKCQRAGAGCFLPAELQST